MVVGGGLATARLCSTLRRKKFRGPITVLSAEHHAPYDRPPLSKDVLHGRRDDTTLPFDVDKLEVDLRLGTPALGLSTSERTVRLQDGSLTYDALAIATGAAPLRLPGPGPQLTLRTLDDALALRERLRPGARVVVIGAGWIGAEVCTAALAAGCEVTCVEFQAQPFAGVLGETVGSADPPLVGRRRPAHRHRRRLGRARRGAPGRRGGPARRRRGHGGRRAPRPRVARRLRPRHRPRRS